MARLPPGPPRRKWPFGLERLRVMAERNPFLVVGLPMLLFVAAGSLALQQFNEVKFRVRDRQTLVRHRMPHVLGILTFYIGHL